jgi:hypothetical protein
LPLQSLRGNRTFRQFPKKSRRFVYNDAIITKNKRSEDGS